MPLTLDMLSVLSDSATRTVFERVVAERSVRLRDLLAKINDRIDRDTAVDRLQKLERAGLIEETKSSVPDLNAYYITANGLKANREIAGR